MPEDRVIVSLLPLAMLMMTALDRSSHIPMFDNITASLVSSKVLANLF
jgi:hypothetical protein